MDIHVIITGFGYPHVEKKLEIARHNRRKFDSCRHRITVTAYVYDDSPIPDGLFDTTIRRQGYVGEFLYRAPEDCPVLGSCDRILLMLDDIEWVSDVDEFIEACEALHDRRPSIFQPSLTPDSQYSHAHMMMTTTDTGMMDIHFDRQKCFEYFCYYMRPETFQEYHGLLAPTTRCMWGLDFIVPGYIPCCLFRGFKIRHWFLGGMMGRDACVREMEEVLRRFPPG